MIKLSNIAQARKLFSQISPYERHSKRDIFIQHFNKPKELILSELHLRKSSVFLFCFANENISKQKLAHLCVTAVFRS